MCWQFFLKDFLVYFYFLYSNLFDNDDLSTFIPVSTSSLDLNKMDKNTISATNSNRTSILSRNTDSDAKIEFRKRLNLNFDFVPVLDVNTYVPDRDEPQELVLIDEIIAFTTFLLKNRS